MIIPAGQYFIPLEDERYWIVGSGSMNKRVHPSMKMILDELCDGENYIQHCGAYEQGIFFFNEDHAIAFKLEYC